MTKKPSNNEKKVTIDTLATMVARGFSGVTSTMVTKDHLDLRLEDYATKDELKFEIKNLKEDINIMLGKHIGTFRKDYFDKRGPCGRVILYTASERRQNIVPSYTTN